jgi:hypothetical protein
MAVTFFSAVSFCVAWFTVPTVLEKLLLPHQDQRKIREDGCSKSLRNVCIYARLNTAVTYQKAVIFQARSHSRQKRELALHVRLSVRMYQRGSHWTDLFKILYLGNFMKTCRETPALVKIAQKYWTLYMKT